MGSIKWKERGRFGAHDLGALAEARQVLPGGAMARLVAIAPRGEAPGVGADLVLDARDLVAAWG